MKRTIGVTEYFSMTGDEQQAITDFVQGELHLDPMDVREVMYDSEGEIVCEVLLRDEHGLAYLNAAGTDTVVERRSFTRTYEPDGPWACTGRKIFS